MQTRILFLAPVALILVLAGWHRAMVVSERDPLVIWHRSITRGAEVPMRAEFTLVQRRHGRMFTTEAHLVQGAQGKYRMEYLLPTEARGRIVYSDGRVNRQYEPRRNLIVETPLGPERIGDERDAEALIGRNYRIVLVSDQEMLFGRTTYLLELLPRYEGKSSQRRWIDRDTFKTLRIETHYPDGILARRLDYRPLALPAQVSDKEFVPAPTGASRGLLTRDVPAPIPASDLTESAHRLGLQSEGVPGFRLAQASSGTLGQTRAAHLIYSDGLESISVFVQNSQVSTPPDAPNWRRITINGRQAFENLDGHLDAVVWMRNGRRYTAVSHLGPKQLQQFIAGQ